MYRFTIRDVLWLTVAVALAVGWWVDHWYLAKDRGRLSQIAQGLHAHIERTTRESFTIQLPDGTEYPPP